MAADFFTPRNITLVGMPASGKSTVAPLLADRLGWRHIDVDALIIEHTGQPLAEIIQQRGEDGFLALESQIVLGIAAEDCVISTGGSVVYEDVSMRHLQSLGAIVHLLATHETLAGRIGDPTLRGVINPHRLNLDGLFAERVPLYEQYASTTIAVDGLSPQRIADGIVASLLGEASTDDVAPRRP